MTRLMLLIRATIVAMLLAFGVVAAAPVVAQDATQAVEEVDDTTDDAVDEVDETTDEAADEAEDVVTEEDGGFEWGLLGLLGLAGLAGLMRRPQPVVHDVDRTANRPVNRVDDRNESGGTSI